MYLLNKHEMGRLGRVRLYNDRNVTRIRDLETFEQELMALLNSYTSLNQDKVQALKDEYHENKLDALVDELYEKHYLPEKPKEAKVKKRVVIKEQKDK